MSVYLYQPPDPKHAILPGTACWVRLPNPANQPGETPLPAAWTQVWFQSWMPPYGATVLFATGNLITFGADELYFTQTSPTS